VQRFREHRASNTPDLSRALDGLETIARVVSLHDGDTLTAVFDALGGFYKIHVRLDGIDAPEVGSKTPANRRVAGMARDRLLELILDDPRSVAALAAHLLQTTKEKEEEEEEIRGDDDDDAIRAYQERKANEIERFLDGGVYLVRVQCGRCEKYGRLLGRLTSAYSDALTPSFNEVLVEERLALPYHGERKMTDAEQMRALGRDENTGDLLPGTSSGTAGSSSIPPLNGGFWRKGAKGYFTGWFPNFRLKQKHDRDSGDEPPPQQHEPLGC
jgi:endonuclease YncB( thermonuclease family)